MVDRAGSLYAGHVRCGGHAVGQCVDRVHVAGHFVGHAGWKCVVHSIIGCRSNSCYTLQGENIIRYRTVYMKFIRSISYAILNATSCHYNYLCRSK